MAKRDRHGKISTELYRRRQLARIFIEMDTEGYKKNKKMSLGARELVIQAYSKNNKIEDAYLAIKVFNEKVGMEVYTKETVNVWVSEYNKKASRNTFDEGR